jgi:hypothetical protein
MPSKVRSTFIEILSIDRAQNNNYIDIIASIYIFGHAIRYIILYVKVVHRKITPGHQWPTAMSSSLIVLSPDFSDIWEISGCMATIGGFMEETTMCMFVCTMFLIIEYRSVE